MLVLLLLVLSGDVPGFREALAGFAEPVTYSLMAVLTLGLAVLRSGLAERVARFFCSAVLVDHRRCMGEPLRLSPGS
jgi:di/tricarboxylate transporter